MIDSVEVGKIVSLLATWWPNFNVTAKATNAGMLDLFRTERATYAEARAALDVMKAQGVEHVNASRIHEALKQVRAATRGKRITQPEEIWVALVKMAVRGCCTGTVVQKCTKRVWTAIQAAGGWERIRTAHTEDELPHVRRAFLDSYNAIKERDEHYNAAAQAIAERGVKAIGYKEDSVTRDRLAAVITEVAAKI